MEPSDASDGYGGPLLEVPRTLLESLVDDENCGFDHDGDCQVHNHFGLRYEGKLCPHEALKRRLAES